MTRTTPELPPSKLQHHASVLSPGLIPDWVGQGGWVLCNTSAGEHLGATEIINLTMIVDTLHMKLDEILERS
ncbi:hypothetical protein AVEN_3040-1 [Araneus ventricosus]|uniref:Uncharacterized protein n=1 Tax=Araneus ventricosus TaxID=182803 RepID=A0A4Y2KJ47_ARAVE|nr:hypothetical protein AVEN_3040-1 [Araneus ventricosus]